MGLGIDGQRFAIVRAAFVAILDFARDRNRPREGGARLAYRGFLDEVQRNALPPAAVVSEVADQQPGFAVPPEGGDVFRVSKIRVFDQILGEMAAAQIEREYPRRIESPRLK